jgi:hypothetical protein
MTTYVQLYSLHGAQPAPLPADLPPDADLAALGYVIAAPRPGVAEGEQAHWNGRYWVARPIAQEAQP